MFGGAIGIELGVDSMIVDRDAFGIGDARHVDDVVGRQPRANGSYTPILFQTRRLPMGHSART